MTATKIILGDVTEALATIEPATIRAVCCSPPYWARRLYTEDDREIGQGTLADWIADLTGVFHNVAPLLTEDAVVWINVGNSSSKSGGSGGDYNAGGSYAGKRKYKKGVALLPDGTVMRPQQWTDAPGRLLHSLQADDWVCRSQIVWSKIVSRPESLRHTKRPGESYEMIYMLVRPEACTPTLHYAFDGTDAMEKGDVWTIPPGRGAGGKAPMPRAIPTRCLNLMGIHEGVVLDPFCGTGSTLEAAAIRGLDSIGIDLDPEAAIPTAERLDAELVRL